MAFLWTRCPCLWQWTVRYFLLWHSISMPDWNKVPNWKKWQVQSKTIFWKSLWCVTPIFIRLHSLWRLFPISSNILHRRCRNSILSLSPVTTCRKQVLRRISSWLIHWLTVWNIFVPELPQASTLMRLLRVCLSSGQSVQTTLWKLPRCVPHVCCGRRLWNSSIRRTRNHWHCVLTHRLPVGHWPNKTRSTTWDVLVSKLWLPLWDILSLCIPMHWMRLSLFRQISPHVLHVILRFIFRKKLTFVRMLTRGAVLIM